MRKFGPKTSDDPALGNPCPACGEPFKEGDYSALVGIGPGSDEEQRERRDSNRPYNSVALEVHWECSPYTEGK